MPERQGAHTLLEDSQSGVNCAFGSPTSQATACVRLSRRLASASSGTPPLAEACAPVSYARAMFGLVPPLIFHGF